MTLYFIIGLVGLTLIYDLVAVAIGGMKNTISWVIYTWSQRFPIIPFLLGIVAGHFFWSQCSVLS